MKIAASLTPSFFRYPFMTHFVAHHAHTARNIITSIIRAAMSSIFAFMALGFPCVVFADSSLYERATALLRAPTLQEYRIHNVFGEKELDMKVSAILNHKALIQNTWYKQGDRIGVFVIENISANSVTLMDKKSGKKELLLQKKVFDE